MEAQLTEDQLTAIKQFAQQAQHSPGPWQVGGHPRDDSGTLWREILAPSPFGPQYIGQALIENAARIVACVNQHDALIAEVQSLRAALEGIFAQTAKHSRQWGQAAGAHAFASDPKTAEAFAQARAALAAAKD